MVRAASGDGHQLIEVPAQPGGQRLAQRGHVGVGGHLGGIHPEHRLARVAHLRPGQRAIPGLPVHLRQPRTGQVPALQPGRDQGRDHAPDPAALPRRRRGIDDLLHVPGRDVLAADRADDRDRTARTGGAGYARACGTTAAAPEAAPLTGRTRSGPRRAASYSAHRPPAARLRAGCGDLAARGRLLRHGGSLSSCVVAGERADDDS